MITLAMPCTQKYTHVRRWEALSHWLMGKEKQAFSFYCITIVTDGVRVPLEAIQSDHLLLGSEHQVSCAWKRTKAKSLKETQALMSLQKMDSKALAKGPP